MVEAKMKKTVSKKLSLSRETIRSLQLHAFRLALGGEDPHDTVLCTQETWSCLPQPMATGCPCDTQDDCVATSKWC